MKTFRWIALIVFPLLALVGVGRAHAQTPLPNVSPFINLNNRNVPAGITYYGIIRPELQFGRSIQQLQVQTQATQQTVLAQQAPAGVLTTGHEVGFLNHNTYFGNLGGPGSTSFNVTRAPTRPTRATSSRGGAR